MNRLSIRLVFLQALTLLLLTSPFVAIGAYVWQKHLWAQKTLSDLEPRHARLQGIKGIQSELEHSVQIARALLASQTYPASLDATQAGNDAQQRIRAVFTDSQLAVDTIQVVEIKGNEQFQRIGVVLRIEGTLPSMQAALLKLKTQTPTILVDSFSIQSIGAAKPASVQRMSGNFNLSVMRSRS